jgi:hypothetical protein
MKTLWGAVKMAYTKPTSVTYQGATPDPFYREAMYGSPDATGFINQATQAAQKAYLDRPLPTQGVAPLSADEQMARDRAVTGLGGYQPYLTSAQNLLTGQPGVSGQPDYQGAEQLYRGSATGFDPTTGVSPYMNPYENVVVQQTISDVLDRADEQSAGLRSRGIQQAGAGAFGSRGRLGQQELYEDVGRGLGETIGGLRSRGYEGARQAAMSEFGRQRGAEAGAARGLAGLSGQLGSLASMGQQLGQGERRELAGYGQIGRGIDQETLNTQYQNQLAQQMAPVQAIQSMQAPYSLLRPSQSTTRQQYAASPSPLGMGLSSFLSAYSMLNRPQSSQDRYYDALTQQMGQPQAPAQASYYDPNTPDYFGVGEGYGDYWGGYGGGGGFDDYWGTGYDPNKPWWT